MESWNYRIIKHEKHFGLHEVYYNHEWRPEGRTIDAIEFACGIEDGAKGIIDSLKMALHDAEIHPVLDVDVFDKPIKERPILGRLLRSALNEDWGL
jgi:hypothetical protein